MATDTKRQVKRPTDTVVPFAPGYDDIITPHLIQGIAFAENEALDENAHNTNTNKTSDKGLMQINDKIWPSAYKERFGEEWDSANEHMKFDPAVNLAVGHTAIIQTRRFLKNEFKKQGLGEFDQLPREEQLKSILYAYQFGAKGFVDNVKADKTTSLRFPSRLFEAHDPGRLERFNRGFSSDIHPNLQGPLLAREQRKSHIIGTSLNMVQAEQRLRDGGFLFDEQPSPVPEKPFDAEKRFQDTFRLPKPDEPLSPQEPATPGVIGQAVNEFVSPLIQGILQTGGIPPEDQIGPIDILNKPVDIGLGVLAGKDFPESGTGQEVNQNLFGTPLADDLAQQAQQQESEFFTQTPIPTAEQFTQQAETQAALQEEVLDSTRKGDITRSIVETIGLAGAGVRSLAGIRKRTPPEPPSNGTAVGSPRVNGEVSSQPSDIILKDIDAGEKPEFIEEVMRSKLPDQPLSARLDPGLVKPIKSSKALAYRRVLRDAIDTMRQMGPTSEGIANQMDNALSVIERGVSELAFRQRAVFEKNFGRRRLAATRGVFKGATTQKFIKISQKESDALVEYMSRKGTAADTILSGPRFNLTPEQIARVKQTGDELFEQVTRPVSNHPVVRTLEVTNPVTGKKVPVGEPSLFFPQIPLTSDLKRLTKGNKFEILYNGAKAEDPTLTRALFRAQLQDKIGAYARANLSADRAAGAQGVRTFAGLEQARLFNPVVTAEANNIPIAEVYRTLGYDDDPIRAITSFTIGGLKRAETGAVYQTLREQLPQVQKELLENPVTEKAFEKNFRFIDDALSHFAGRGGGDLLDTELKGTIANVLGFNSATMLQAAFISNMAQFSVIGTQATIPSIIKGIAHQLNVFKRGDDVAKRSGSNYITMAQEWQKPDSFFGKLAQHFLRTGGFTPSEKFIRVIASNIGKAHVLNIARQIQKTPRIGAARHKLKWDGMAIEMGLDPRKLREELAQSGGMLSNESLYRGVTTFVNRTAGRTDMRGIPLWAAEHKPVVKAILQFKNFALTNLNSIEKMIIDAPTPMIGVERAIKAFGMGTSAGLIVNSMKDVLIKQISPTSEEGTVGKLQRETAKEIGHSLIVGMGNVFGMLAASVMAGEQGVSDFIIGTTGGMAVDVAVGTYDAFKGKLDPLDVQTQIVGRVPGVPLLPKTVAASLRSKKKQRKETDQLLRRLGVIEEPEDQLGRFDSLF